MAQKNSHSSKSNRDMPIKSQQTVFEEYAERFLFDPYAKHRRPNEIFYRMFATRMIAWAKELVDKIQKGELDPSTSWHPLTFTQFYREQGIRRQLVYSWIEDSPLVKEAFEFTRDVLADLNHAAALWGKGNAVHIGKTLGYYSHIFKEEQERISKLTNNDEDVSKTITVEMPCYKEHTNECRDENKA